MVQMDFPIFVDGMDTRDFFEILEKHKVQVVKHFVTGVNSPIFTFEAESEAQIDSLMCHFDSMPL